MFKLHVLIRDPIQNGLQIFVAVNVLLFFKCKQKINIVVTNLKNSNKKFVKESNFEFFYLILLLNLGF